MKRRVLRFPKKKAARKKRLLKRRPQRFSREDWEHGLIRNDAVLIWLKEALIAKPEKLVGKLKGALELNSRMAEEHIKHGKVNDTITAPLRRIISTKTKKQNNLLEKLVARIEREIAIQQGLIRKSA